MNWGWKDTLGLVLGMVLVVALIGGCFLYYNANTKRAAQQYEDSEVAHYQKMLSRPCINQAFNIAKGRGVVCADPRQYIVVNREGPLPGSRNDDEERTDVVLCVCGTPTVQ